jgi:hypothetical protein
MQHCDNSNIWPRTAIYTPRSLVTIQVIMMGIRQPEG